MKTTRVTIQNDKHNNKRKENTMIKFKEHDGLLFKMLEEPVPLTPDAEMPCLTRLIQDDSRMGMFNRDTKPSRLSDFYLVARIVSNNIVVDEFMESDYNRFEIIGTPVAEGSSEWRNYQLVQGKCVYHPGDSEYYQASGQGRIIGKLIENNEFNSTWNSDTFMRDDSDGWQIYEEPREEPKLPKEQKIDSGKKEYTCLVCGKKMSGLDGRAEVSIKRISISNLYESTLSHYCGSCFLKLGFDATEKELRSRQQPNPEPTFKVGDWVKYDIDSYLQVIEPSGKERTLCRTLSGVIVYPYTSLLTKASPSEVVVRIGCLSGTVEPVSTNGIHIWFHLIGVDDKIIATIRISCLDTPTREIVESLLKAQE